MFLRYVSPELLKAKGLELAVPGTYDAGAEVVRIQSFGTSLRVITSKQRPRKLSMLGNDGRTYDFLLKVKKKNNTPAFIVFQNLFQGARGFASR